MGRTQAPTTRTTKAHPSAKPDRKSAAKSDDSSKRAAATTKGGRTPSTARDSSRQEIRTRVPASRTSPVKAPGPAVKPAQETPKRAPKVVATKDSDNLKTMRKTAADKTKIVAKAEHPAPPAPADAPRAKGASVEKQAKVRAPKAAAKPVAAEAELKPAPGRRKRGAETDANALQNKATRGSRSKTFGFDDELMQDYVMDEDVAPEELDEELAMEPMELPLELLDPELIEVPRPASVPKPKPKPVASKRQQVCASCGNTYTWLSVEQFCFSCLKKKLAQRKREDESYPGFTGEAEEEEDAS